MNSLYCLLDHKTQNIKETETSVGMDDVGEVTEQNSNLIKIAYNGTAHD